MPQPTSPGQARKGDAVPQAQIVKAWAEGGFAHLAVRVAEPGPPARDTEYIGTIPMDDAWQAMSPAQKKAALVAAAKATRDASIRAAEQDLGISGSVTL